MPTVGEGFSLGDSGKHKGHRRKGVILNANGQVVAHIWGHAKVVDANFRFAPTPGGKDEKFFGGDGDEGDGLF